MKKFIALYYNTSGHHSPPPSMTAEEQQAMMAPWGAWQAKYGERIIDLGAPLESAMSSTGTNWSESQNLVTGYSIVAAENMEEAQAMFIGHPIYSYPDHAIELSAFASM